jgi:hypothetical protein
MATHNQGAAYYLGIVIQNNYLSQTKFIQTLTNIQNYKQILGKEYDTKRKSRAISR